MNVSRLMRGEMACRKIAGMAIAVTLLIAALLAMMPAIAAPPVREGDPKNMTTIYQGELINITDVNQSYPVKFYRMEDSNEVYKFEVTPYQVKRVTKEIAPSGQYHIKYVPEGSTSYTTFNTFIVSPSMEIKLLDKPLPEGKEIRSTTKGNKIYIDTSMLNIPIEDVVEIKEKSGGGIVTTIATLNVSELAGYPINTSTWETGKHEVWIETVADESYGLAMSSNHAEITIYREEIKIEVDPEEPAQNEEVIVKIIAPPNTLFNFSTSDAEYVLMTSKEDNPLNLDAGETCNLTNKTCGCIEFDYGWGFNATTDENGECKFVLKFIEDRTYTLRAWYDASKYGDQIEESKKDHKDVAVSPPGEPQLNVSISKSSVPIGGSFEIYGISSSDYVEVVAISPKGGNGTGMDGLYGVSIYTVPTFNPEETGSYKIHVFIDRTDSVDSTPNRDDNYTFIIIEPEIDIEAETTSPSIKEKVLFTVKSAPYKLFNFSTTYPEDVVMTSYEDNPLGLSAGEVVPMNNKTYVVDVYGEAGKFNATTDEDGTFKFVAYFTESGTFNFRVWYDADTYANATGKEKDDINIDVGKTAVNSFYKRIKVDSEADTGIYTILVLSPGTDDVYGNSSYKYIDNILDLDGAGPELGAIDVSNKTQEGIVGTIENATINQVGSDDLLWKGYLTVYQPKIIYVDDDFEDDPASHIWNTIQEGINDANGGDTVIVYNGTYYENLEVNKTLSLLGEGMPTIDAQCKGAAIKITANNCVVKGFKSFNGSSCEPKSGSGIIVESNGNIIENNICGKNTYGIYLNSSNNVISNNTIYGKFRAECSGSLNATVCYYEGYGGIYLYESTTNLIINNTIRGEVLTGIYLQNSSNNTILNNDIDNNYCGYNLDNCGSIYSIESSGNIISNNTCKKASRGVYLDKSSSNTVSNNTCKSNNLGIHLRDSSNNTILNNICEGNEDGILLSYCSENSIVNNLFENNSFSGIRLFRSTSNNIISKNNCKNNHCGIFLHEAVIIIIHKSEDEAPSDNLIYLNNFINNSYNINSQTFNNIWNSTEPITYIYKGITYRNYLGNYWSDYKGSDADKDGIGDTPYTIDSDRDNYPLIEPYENYFVSPPAISLTEAWHSDDIGLIGKIVVTDVDNDGDNEIVAAVIKNLTNDVWHGHIYVFDAKSHRLEWISEDIGQIICLNVSDLDGDGVNEIIARTWSYPYRASGNRHGYLFVFSGKDYSLKWKSKDIGMAGWSGIYHLQVDDLDGDGVQEIVTKGLVYWTGSTARGYVYVFDGRNFTLKWQSPDIGNPNVIRIDDVDDDGVKEIVIATYDSWFEFPGKLIIYNGTTYAREYENDIGAVLSMEIADVDNDGTKEIVTGGQPCVSSYVKIFDGKTLQQEWQSSNLGEITKVCVDDADNDGTKEILVTVDCWQYPDGLIYIYNGVTHEQEWCSGDIGNIGYTLETCDIDRDGEKEIVSGGGGCLRIFKFQEGEWKEVWRSKNFNIGGRAIVIADLDNDGYNEVITGGNCSSKAIDYYNRVYYGSLFVFTTHPTPTTLIFDTGSSPNPYPSIPGTYNGKIIPASNITARKFFVYPCAGTGGHAEYVRIWGGDVDAHAFWNGYSGREWNILHFNNLTLEVGEEYNITIKIGSYPQIFHQEVLETLDGSIMRCEEFVDANGKRHKWIPAFKIF